MNPLVESKRTDHHRLSFFVTRCQALRILVKLTFAETSKKGSQSDNCVEKS